MCRLFAQMLVEAEDPKEHDLQQLNTKFNGKVILVTLTTASGLGLFMIGDIYDYIFYIFTVEVDMKQKQVQNNVHYLFKDLRTIQ